VIEGEIEVEDGIEGEGEIGIGIEGEIEGEGAD
jgi:hypothetical protein